jgi:hypothetical protein
MLASLVLVLTAHPASADCFIHGMRPTDHVVLPTADRRQAFSFIASDDCATLRLSIRGTGLSWRPKGGGPTGPGPSTYRVVLSDEEWDEVVALTRSSLTWVVTGTTSEGVVTHVSTTNDLQRPARDLETADATLIGDGWWTGASLAAVGDVDGDGQVDVLIGSPWKDDGVGSVYDRIGAVYLSTGPVRGTIDLSEVGTQFIAAAPTWGDGPGASVASAGDVNADGYDDVTIGAPGDTDESPGAAYLVLGPVTGSFDLSLADAMFFGNYEDEAGASVSSAGDMDGDGLPDLLVGAPHTYWDATYAGAAYVVSGTRRGSHRLRATDARMYGDYLDFVGNSVSGLGDVDGDGFDDILDRRPLGGSLRIGKCGSVLRAVRAGRRPLGSVRCRRDARGRVERRHRGRLHRGRRRRRRGRSPRHPARRGRPGG